MAGGVEGPDTDRGTEGVGLDKTETEETETSDVEDALNVCREGRRPRYCFAGTLGASLSFALYVLVLGGVVDLFNLGRVSV